MNEFETKYNVKETKKTILFHKSRQMFCIRDNSLFLGPKGSTWSHAVWFENEGWLTKENTKVIDEAVRGYVSKDGDIYFYTGFDFSVNSKSESIFFLHLKEITSSMKLAPRAKIFGGLIKDREGKFFPRKSFGTVNYRLHKT